MGLVDMAMGLLIPGAAPISTLTLCMSGEMSVDDRMVVEAATEEPGSALILARVGVMGSVLAETCCAAGR